jgi:hypothetical protein
MSEWTKEDFTRRQYKVQQSDEKELDKARRIELSLKIDGRPYLNIQLREPGILAIVSRPDDPDGFEVEIVTPGGKRYTDMRLPSGAHTPPLEDWQCQALKI